MLTDFSVSKFRPPPQPLFHPESMLARKPWLTKGHRKMPLIPANPVVFYVLYENPPDFPLKFVIRCWRNQTPDPKPMCVCTNLPEAMLHLPKKVLCVGRNMGDPPIIKDVWIAAWDKE